MGDFYAIAVIGSALPQEVFLSARADICIGETVIDGRLFLASRRGEVAACAEFGDNYIPGVGNLSALAGRLGAVAECDHDSATGLTIVSRLRLVYGRGQHVWRRGWAHDLLSDTCRAWAGHVAVAAMALHSRATLPVPPASRPDGDLPAAVIAINGDIVAGSARRAITLMGDAEQYPRSVVLDIRSKGGNFDEAMQLYRALAAWPYAVYANIRTAESAAALVAMAADTRTLTPNGSMLLHPVRVDLRDGSTSYTPADLIALTKRMLGNMSDMVDVVAAGTGNTRAQAEAWCCAETPFNAGDALRCGLVHAIRDEDVPADPRPRRAKFAPINAPFLRERVRA